MAKSTRSARAVAVDVLVAVLQQQRSLTAALHEHLADATPGDQALVKQLCYGVCRSLFSLTTIAQRLLNKPFKAKDFDLWVIVLVGLYQLRSLRIPDHAAIAETVQLAKVRGKPWAAGVINASLRRWQREADALSADWPQAAQTEHPDWLTAALARDWPEAYENILLANQQQAPMMLRVNRLQTSQQAYLQQLADAGIAAEPLAGCDHGIRLAAPVDVSALPGFAAGWVSVQDGSAQRAAPHLQLTAGLRVLDACAAPGGKTAHILELAPDNTVVALDISAARLTQVAQSLSRLHLEAQLQCGDASTRDWWDGVPFDRILVDAPCSGTGVIRRHPDIKCLRQATDIPALAVRQQAILRNLWSMLKPGGLMLYTTCSMLKAENQAVIAHFLADTPDAQHMTLEPPPAPKAALGYQRLVGDEDLDGFYYACLQRA